MTMREKKMVYKLNKGYSKVKLAKLNNVPGKKIKRAKIAVGHCATRVCN